MSSEIREQSEVSVSFLVKLGYSFGNFGESIAYNLFYLFFMLFLTAVAGIDPAVAGTISLVAVLWDAVTDPLIGFWSDNTKSKRGRRRPFLLRFCVPLGAVVFFMFTVPGDASGAVQIVYFLLMNILFWMFFTAVDIPYISLAGEIVTKPSEKTTIRSMATMWNFAGFVVVASGALAMVVSFADKEKYPEDMAILDPKAWSTVAALMGILTIISFLIAYLSTRGKEPVVHTQEHAERPNFFKEYLSVLKIRSFRPLIFFNVFSQIAGYLLTALAMHFFIYSMGASEGQISIIFLIYGIMIIVMSPAISFLGNKFGKKTLLLIFNSINVVIFFVFWLVGFNFTTIYFFDFGIALFFGSFYILAFSATYDIAEVDKLQRKKRDSRQGIVFALFSFMMKAGIGLGMFTSGMLLKTIGFDESVMEQSEKALRGLHNGMTIIPAIFFLIGVLFLIFYPITKKTLDRIHAASKLAEAGEEFSTDGLENILR